MIAMMVAACAGDAALPRPVPAAVVATTAAVTMAEAEAFAKEFAASMTTCDPARFTSHLDFDPMLDRMVANAKQPARAGEIEKLRAQLARSMATSQCASLDAQKASYTYLRTRMRDGIPRPLFRIAGENGLDYHELVLDKRPTGIKITDIELHGVGDRMSELLRTGADGMLVKDMDPLNAVTDLLRASKWAEALAMIDGLPQRMRDNKLVVKVEAMASCNLGTPRCLRVVETYAKRFPDDPSLDLWLLPAELLQGHHAEAFATLDRIDRRVGGDPMLDVLRASAFSAAGQPAKAVAAAQRAIAAEPTLQVAYALLLPGQVAIKDFKGAVATLKELDHRFHAAPFTGQLQADPLLAPLVESDEYRKWSEHR